MVKHKFIIITIIIIATSCSSRPKLYPNETYKKKGREIAEKDIDDCISEADKFLKSSKGKKMVKSAGFGAAVGGAVGAVAGIFYGDVTGGAARGAAVGGAGGAATGALSPDEVKQQYVNQCLSEKGHHVLGWD